MERRNFLAMMGAAALPDFSHFAEKLKQRNLRLRETLHKEEAIEQQIAETRRSIQVGKRNIRHAKNLARDFGNHFRSKLNISTLNQLTICAIENGKPWNDYDSGRSVDSGTGCKGLAQISFSAFIDARTFAKRFRINTPLTQLDNDRALFEDLFQGPELSYKNQRYSSAELQIDSLNAYLKYLEFVTGDFSTAVFAYGNGIGTLEKLVQVYMDYREEKVTVDMGDPRRFKNLIKLYGLNPEYLLAHQQVAERFEQLMRIDHRLRKADPLYYSRFVVARETLNSISHRLTGFPRDRMPAA